MGSRGAKHVVCNLMAIVDCFLSTAGRRTPLACVSSPAQAIGLGGPLKTTIGTLHPPPTAMVVLFWNLAGVLLRASAGQEAPSELSCTLTAAQGMTKQQRDLMMRLQVSIMH